MFRIMGVPGRQLTVSKLETQRISPRTFPLLALPILLTLLLFACGKEPQPSVEPEVQKPVVKERLPANFVVCIDNSASIRGEERVLIRETTMLLADLADTGDRISVITFGERARLAASYVLQTDQDRIAFKNQVKVSVNFSENYSDIRAGIKVLAEPDSPLGHEGFDPYIIILSDGKLEPADRNTRRAFNEMRELLQNQLAQTNFYAVVLGNTYCYNSILTNIDGTELNGKRLMRDYIARSPDRFFHAERLDQLFEIAVRILNTAKGITSLGEKKKTNQFKIDDSVESMTLIVQKMSSNGTSLCTSSEIILNKPKEGPGRAKESVYKSSDYQFFDLIVVRNPREGMWSIALANGNQPEVFSKIVTPLDLRFSYRDKYYLNETATMRAWIFNKQTTQVASNKSYLIKAHLTIDEKLDASNVYGDFHADPNSGQYYLEVPGEILELSRLEGKPATVTMEVTAQRFRPNSEQLDPWFIRRVGPVNVQLVEPFVDWLIQKPRVFNIPFIGRILYSVFEVPIIDEGLLFGAVLRLSHSQCPAFEGLPRLKFVLEILDQESESYLPVVDMILDGTDEVGEIVYGAKKTIKEPGIYRYYYQLDGVAKLGGAFTIKSPSLKFEIKSYKFECWLAIIISVLFFVCLIYYFTGKLQGDLTIKEYKKGKLVKSEEEQLYQRTYYSEYISLKARRCCLLKNKISIIFQKSNADIVIDKLPTNKKKEYLDPGDHEIVLIENDSETIIQVDIHV